MSERTERFLDGLKDNPGVKDCPAYAFSGSYFNGRQKAILGQLAKAAEDRGNAPIILFPEDYWDIVNRTDADSIPEMISPFTVTIADIKDENGIQNFLSTLRDYSEEKGEVGDIAYITEMFSRRALGQSLSPGEKREIEAFKAQNCPDLVKTSWNDMNMTYALAVEEYCRGKGINVEITAAVDSGKCSMTFESIMDSVRAGAIGEDSEHFKMMEESVKQLCLVEENGTVTIVTRSELRQVDTFDDKKAQLEKLLRELYQKAATDREAAEKLRNLQRQMVEACHRIEREKAKERSERQRRRFLEEKEKENEEERAREEAERYFREHNVSVGKDPENPANGKKNAVEAMAKVFILAGFMSTTIKEPLGEAFKTHAMMKITDIQKTEAALANAKRDSMQAASKDKEHERDGKKIAKDDGVRT